jgi:class 3 adenylate cyclase
VGAAVNRAAWLEPLAPSGGIALDGETVALLDGAHKVTEYGAHALKGFRDPVPVYLVA